MTQHEEPFIERLRRQVVEQYADIRLGSGQIGGGFGEILCHEIHHGADGRGLHFTTLADKWGIPVSVLGDLISDHCRRMEPSLSVNHEIPLDSPVAP